MERHFQPKSQQEGHHYWVSTGNSIQRGQVMCPNYVLRFLTLCDVMKKKVKFCMNSMTTWVIVRVLLLQIIFFASSFWFIDSLVFLVSLQSVHPPTSPTDDPSTHLAAAPAPSHSLGVAHCASSSLASSSGFAVAASSSSSSASFTKIAHFHLEDPESTKYTWKMCSLHHRWAMSIRFNVIMWWVWPA